ncbi:MAG: hypothetical protein CNLJKLNK_00169 [Holosporales bacterium]
MKKIRYILPFMALTTVFAEEKKPFTGVYVGGMLGGNLLGGDIEFTNTANKGKVAARKFGMLGGLCAGYMKFSDNKAWFAGEIYFNAKTGKDTKEMKDSVADVSLGTLQLQNKSILGGAVLIGAAVNPKLVVYAKAAYEMSSYSFDFKGLTTATTTYSTKKNISSVVPTAGALYKLSESLLVGVEGGYVISTKTISLTFNEAYNVTYKPTEYRVSLTARWVF